jgi:tetratricopeptide (TPR) repeat protein
VTRLLLLSILCLVGSPLFPADDLTAARDRQDIEALKQLASSASAAAKDAASHYRSALASLYLAEVALQKNDKKLSGQAAEAGIEAARRAVEAKPATSEYHRVLGTLCGQIIPANVLMGLKYGRCALDEITRAIELDPKAPLNYLSRGVGNFYLPPQFGGSPEKALEDFDRSLKLDPKLAEAHLWRGMALRKLGRNPDARKAFEQTLALNPNRLWAKDQLARTAGN